MKTQEKANIHGKHRELTVRQTLALYGTPMPMCWGITCGFAYAEDGAARRR
jgi:hypothetical protein